MRSVLVVALVATIMPVSADAVVINFNEMTSSGGPAGQVRELSTTVMPEVLTAAGGPNLPGCGGGAALPCVSAMPPGTETGASVQLQVPKGVFPPPAGGVARAYLLDPDQKTISDIITLTVVQGPAAVNFDTVTLRFTSDGDPSGLGQVPAGFIASFTAIEDNKLDDLSSVFFTGPVDNAMQQRAYIESAPLPPPGRLPSGYTVQARSDVDEPDVIPEPAGIMVLTLGVLGITFARYWQSSAGS